MASVTTRGAGKRLQFRVPAGIATYFCLLPFAYGRNSCTAISYISLHGFLSETAATDLLYVGDGGLMRTNLFVADLTSKLYTVDPATGSIGLVGPCGIASVTDIAFHGPTLYGVSFSQLLRLNPDTGAAVVIGAIGFSTNGLAVAEDGIIYAGTTNGQLITVNPVSGAGTLVGAFGGGLISGGDLVLDANGILYGALASGGNTVLARIDRNTGAATVIGATGIANVYGLALTCCRMFGGTANGELLSVNVATGVATIIGKSNIVMGGMAARCCCCS